MTNHVFDEPLVDLDRRDLAPVMTQHGATDADVRCSRLIVNCDGGLGNQMFEYAAGLYFARVFSRSLEVLRPTPRQQQWNGFSRPFQLSQFQITAPAREANKLDRLMISRSKNARRVRGAIERILRVQMLEEPKMYAWQPELIDAPSQQTAYLVGYWQAAECVEAVAPQVREQFKLRNSLQTENLRYAALIAEMKCPVSLHVRLGDYKLIQHAIGGGKTVSQMLSRIYYDRALAALEKAVGSGYTLIVFSDDPASARELLYRIPNFVLIEGNSADTAHEEMFLMSLCSHHIIANSSFSWWGAWLNSKPGKRVFAPRCWGNTPDSHFPDLYPSGWEIVDNL